MSAQTDSLRKFAILATRAKMHAKARELWQRLVAADGTDAAAHFNLANAASSLGAVDAALASYDAAIEATTDASLQQACRANASCACIKARRPERALDYCRAGDSPTVMYNLNTALRQLGRQGEAIRITWAKIRESAPPRLRAYIDSPKPARTTVAPASTSITVVCVKWGAKYDAEYVNKLGRACRRHLQGCGKLVCFTDDAEGLGDIVEARPLPSTSMQAWWLKAYLFSKAARLAGPVLYLDLDTVVCGDLGPLAALAASSNLVKMRRPTSRRWRRLVPARHSHADAQATLGTAALRNENRAGGYNSSVLAWTAPRFGAVWDLLDEPGAYESVARAVYKFDHWLEMLVEDATIVQDETGAVVEYASMAEERPPPGASVVCFPLTPKPHEVHTAFIREHWV